MNPDGPAVKLWEDVHTRRKPVARWSVYIVRCRDGALYTGIATDVSRRLSEHVRGDGRGAKYLRGRAPLRLVFVRRIGSRARAQKLEYRIKTLRRAQKEALIVQENETGRR